jgi:hypothetical protein
MRHMDLVFAICQALEAAEAQGHEGRLALLDVIVTSIGGEAEGNHAWAREEFERLLASYQGIVAADAQALDVPEFYN